MRSRRVLTSLLVGSLLLAIPAIARAQQPVDLPRALAPDGIAPLEGTMWRLRGFSRRGAERQPGPEVAASIRLRGGRLTGSGGCARIRGSYAAVGQALQVDLARSKPLACAEQSALVQVALREGLAAAASFELVEGASTLETQLLLTDGDGTDLLRFGVDDARPLAPGEWQLDSLTASGQRTDADPTQLAVLSFQPRRSNAGRRRSSGEIVGSTGCNGVLGKYDRRADLLGTSALEVTDAPCSRSLATQEAVFLEVLGSESLEVRLPPDRLILTATDSGDQLEFSSASALEGGTWLLQRIGNSEGSPRTVTLRLLDGELGGEGPCGAYRGSYSTGGAFISFWALEGAAASGCDDRRTQRDLLEALRRTVMLDRSSGDLRLQDAAGKELARFGRAGGP